MYNYHKPQVGFIIRRLNILCLRCSQLRRLGKGRQKKLLGRVWLRETIIISLDEVKCACDTAVKGWRILEQSQRVARRPLLVHRTESVAEITPKKKKGK